MKRLFVASVILTILSAIVFAHTSSATGNGGGHDPVKRCQALGYDYGYKFDNLKSPTFNVPSLGSLGIPEPWHWVYVIVKGGSGPVDEKAYAITPTRSGFTVDNSGLVNKGGKVPDISHVIVCKDRTETQPTTTTTTTTTSTTTTTVAPTSTTTTTVADTTTTTTVLPPTTTTTTLGPTETRPSTTTTTTVPDTTPPTTPPPVEWDPCVVDGVPYDDWVPVDTWYPGIGTSRIGGTPCIPVGSPTTTTTQPLPTTTSAPTSTSLPIPSSTSTVPVTPTTVSEPSTTSTPPPTSPDTTVTPTTSVSTPTTPYTTDTRELPVTGGSNTNVALVALALILGGGGILVAARRK